MKKQNLKKLLLRKNVIANLSQEAQNQAMGGLKTQTDCQPHSFTCLLECLPTGRCVNEVTTAFYIPPVSGIDNCIE